MSPYYQQDGITIYCGRCEDMLPTLGCSTVSVTVTSPPYNLGSDDWQCGGGGRQRRDAGIGYSDDLPEDQYQAEQVKVMNEVHRVSMDGASLFYNHKVRSRDGVVLHPVAWLSKTLWKIRQEVIWDRGSTHNMGAKMFWPVDERIYWLTKGKPLLPPKPIGLPSIWRLFGPVPSTPHPAPFREEIPARCLSAVGQPGSVVLDPYCGSGTTLVAAKCFGYRAIGIDCEERYCEIAANRLAQGVLFGAGVQSA